jgi:hypothetical protein
MFGWTKKPYILRALKQDFPGLHTNIVRYFKTEKDLLNWIEDNKGYLVHYNTWHDTGKNWVELPYTKTK